MGTVVDVPHLVAALAKCLAVTGGLQPSAAVVQRLTNLGHDILLGLYEVNHRFPDFYSCLLYTRAQFSHSAQC